MKIAKFIKQILKTSQPITSQPITSKITEEYLAKEFLKAVHSCWVVFIALTVLLFLLLIIDGFTSPHITKSEVEFNKLIPLVIITSASLITQRHELILNLFFRISAIIKAHSTVIKTIYPALCCILSFIFVAYSRLCLDYEFDKILRIYLPILFILILIYNIILNKSHHTEVAKIRLPFTLTLICAVRISLPSLLAIVSTVKLSVYGPLITAIPVAISILLIYRAQPKRSHFITKCRACGKELYLGSAINGCCAECAPQKSISQQTPFSS